MKLNLRDIVNTSGWGHIPEPTADTLGKPFVIVDSALTDDEETILTDSFRIVATCLLNDPDGTYAALLEALMDGAA